MTILSGFQSGMDIDQRIHFSMDTAWHDNKRATAHSLLWHGNKPVFVDVNPNTPNMDTTKIKAAITPQTTSIMPVRCQGNPCEADAMQAIADRISVQHSQLLARPCFNANP